LNDSQLIGTPKSLWFDKWPFGELIAAIYNEHPEMKINAIFAE
jgi:exopolysaccharide biosynthesis predicted pyruvyltransferase EpsI